MKHPTTLTYTKMNCPKQAKPQYRTPIHLSYLIYPLTKRVVGAPQMILQPVSSIFPCSPLPSGTWQTPGLSTPWCCLRTSSSVCLVFFFPLSLCPAIWFWPDLKNGRHDHTTAVCVSLPWSGGLCVVWLPAGSWHGLPHWQHGLCIRCVVSCCSNSFPWLVFFFGALLWGSMIHKHTGRWMWQGSTSVLCWSWEKYSCQSSWFQPCQCCCCLCYPGYSPVSGLQSSSVITEPRYLKLVTVSSFCPFTLISVLMPLVLFVISLVFSALISMP